MKGSFPLLLGPFTLDGAIGQGGMATVYAATHQADGRRVAVKVLKPRSASREHYIRAFRHEIRAVAALDHPHIVDVYDHGLVPSDDPALAKAGLVPGTPYLAMRYVPDTLASRPPLHLGDLVDALLAILDGLAHAHARGVIHRDLKPGNVLVGHSYTDVHLTDFGIAHAMEARDRPFSGGTPGYMAPEQLTGQARAQGPWTDLYGLGCMAWRLCSRDLPWPETGAAEALEARQTRPTPSIQPHMVIGDDFEGWIRRLLSFRPEERFESAAQAAWSLSRLDLPAPDASAPAAPLHSDDFPTEQMISRITLRFDEDQTTVMSQRPAWLDFGPPPFPDDWRVPGTRRRALLGTGLSLVDLRVGPMVGRIEERDLLWSTLRTVRERREVQAVILRGARGTGKTRLLNWLSDRAQERGVTRRMWVRHSPDRGPEVGLGPALARWFRVDNLDRIRREHWLKWHLARIGGQSSLVPEIGDLVSVDAQRQFIGPREWAASWRPVLTAMAGHHPLLICIDNCHYGVETLGWVREILRNPPPCGVMLVMAASEEHLAEQPEAERLLRDLSAHGATEISLDGLEQKTLTELLADQLGLEASLASMVAGKAGGSPLFAMQMVSAWATQQRLKSGMSGYQLRGALEELVPSNLVALWRSRMEAFFAAHPQASPYSLEIAAALGQDVRDREWKQACEIAGTEPSEAILEWLLETGLARRPPHHTSRFQFAHGMLLEAIEQHAREAGRWRDAHRACVSMLYRQGGGALRLAHHLFQCGETLGAAEAFLEAIGERLDYSDFHGAMAACHRWELAMSQSSCAAEDERWGTGWLLKARAAAGLSQMEEAEALCARVEDLGQAFGWGKPWDHAPEARANLRLRTGAFEEGAALYAVTAERCEARGDLNGEIRARRGMAWSWTFLGRYREAMALLEQVMARTPADHPERGVAESWRLMGVCSRGLGDWAHTEACYLKAIEVGTTVRTRSRAGHAECMAGVGDARRWLGDMDGAMRAYDASIRLLEDIGLPTDLASLNRGLAYLGAERFEEARQIFEMLDERWQSNPDDPHRPLPLLGMLPCLAQANEWDTWLATAQTCVPALTESGLIDRDIAWMAGLAARTSPERGERPWAAALQELSDAQWAAMDEPA